jgi:hypothetical protein
MGVRRFSILICEQCLNLEGEMCHNAYCTFCRRMMAEVGEYLDILHIRPVIDGERLAADRGTKVRWRDDGEAAAVPGKTGAPHSA